MTTAAVRGWSPSKGVVETIVEKSRHIIEKYFAKPVKTASNEVPFESDELVLKFKRPIYMNYFASFSREDFGSKRYVRPNIWVYLDSHPANELKMTLRNGQPWSIRVMYGNGDRLWIDVDAASALNVLLVSGVFDTLSEVEMRSERGEADKWLYEFLDTYREIRSNINYSSLLSPGNLFDARAVISGVDMEFFWFGEEYDGGIHSYYSVKVSYEPGEGITVKLLEDRRRDLLGLTFEVGEVLYSLDERRIVYNQMDETILAEFPVGVLDALEDFLERFFGTYLAVLVAVRSLQV